MNTHLLNELAFIPSHWRLVPVNGRKQPLGMSWQHHPFSPQQLLAHLNRGRVPVLGKNHVYTVRPAGYALLCGQTQWEYLIAVDCDGILAHQRLQTLLGGSIPPTIAFSSGRPGRCQYLFAYYGESKSLRSRKITQEGATLEFRGERQISVLPPSPHPLTGQYRWIQGCRPDQIAIQTVPNAVIKLMQSTFVSRKIYPSRTRGNRRCNRGVAPSTSITQAQDLLTAIHPRFADDYQSWIFTGMALKFISPNLLYDWDKWSAQSAKYRLGEPQYKWDSFQSFGISDRYLWWLAQQ